MLFQRSIALNEITACRYSFLHKVYISFMSCISRIVGMDSVVKASRNIYFYARQRWYILKHVEDKRHKKLCWEYVLQIQQLESTLSYLYHVCSQRILFNFA